MKTKKLLLLTALAMSVGATWAQGPNETGTYYKNANGQSGENLRTALSRIIGGPKVTSYDGLISAYEKTDTRTDGCVRDWYSKTTNYRHGKDTGGYKKEGDSYNREHSVPQSWFSKKSPMKSDIVHVVPTDGYVNNRRSSYPFGNVSKTTYVSNQAYCKLGSCGSSGYSGTVFEPGDDIKGDIARIYFYMATCYKDQCSGWGGNIFTSTGIVQWELNQMMEWSKADPVDAVEVERNKAVYGVQQNRNPFVDYPGLEDYIWGNKKDQHFSYDQYEGGSVVDVPTVASPTFTPDAGTYYHEVTVTIASATEGAAIYYTTDGADASTNSLLYTEPIKLTKTSTIKAVAVKDDKMSYQTTAFYLITDEQQPENPEQGEDNVEPTDGTIDLDADFFGCSYTGAVPASYTEDMTGMENGITVVYSLDEGSNRFANGEQIRLYPGNKLVFSVAQGTITGLEFAFASGTPSTTLTVGGNNLSEGKWTGSAQQVTVTLGSGKHARIVTVKVTTSGTSDIGQIEAASLDGQRVVYNLRGQRVAHPTRGLYIVDGKKIFME